VPYQTNQNSHSRKQHSVFDEHNYASTKVKTREIGTQTEASEFISDDNVNFYTGIPKLQIFLALLAVLKDALPKKRFRSISFPDQILLVLMRLRLGLLFQDLAQRFFIKESMARQISDFWIPTMSKKLDMVLAFLPNSLIQKSMPMHTRLRYPKLRCIIDCTEIFTEKPLKLLTRAQMFSHYKSHQTIKYLIGIAPNGLITFLSAGYSGRASDLCVVRNSGFLDLIEPRDQIMADRGFNIEDDLRQRGAKLVIPTFTRGKTQLSQHEVVHTRRVANVRIHVERAIRRIRCFRILNGNFPITQIRKLDVIVKVICILCNLKKDLIKD